MKFFQKLLQGISQRFKKSAVGQTVQAAQTQIKNNNGLSSTLQKTPVYMIAIGIVTLLMMAFVALVGGYLILHRLKTDSAMIGTTIVVVLCALFLTIYVLPLLFKRAATEYHVKPEEKEKESKSWWVEFTDKHSEWKGLPTRTVYVAICVVLLNLLGHLTEFQFWEALWSDRKLFYTLNGMILIIFALSEVCKDKKVKLFMNLALFGALAAIIVFGLQPYFGYKLNKSSVTSTANTPGSESTKEVVKVGEKKYFPYKDIISCDDVAYLFCGARKKSDAPPPDEEWRLHYPGAGMNLDWDAEYVWLKPTRVAMVVTLRK